ncbi:MAG: flavodoxin domain-containing protein [Clostridia bacterium]|nr:flavodoxin domain-containing protein [Clostridia bacterium]
MKKAAVIYWSGTGNTEQMANAVLEGMKSAGAEAVSLTPSQVNDGVIDGLEAIAFGCPSMGAEVLEEEEFEPMFNGIKGKLAGKAVALFGSYGWGDGEWMRNWEADCKASGITLANECIICNEAPEADTVEDLKAMGAKIVQ